MAYEAETPRLYLERLSIDKHFEDFWEMWTDPRSMVWSTQGPKRTAEEAKDWMLLQLPNEKNPNIDKFALLLKPNPANPQPWLNAKGEPKAIGIVGTNRDSPQGLETGYCINIAYWGHGYASEGFAAFLKLFWALEERQNVSFLVAKVDPENFASARILEKSRARKGELLTGIWKRKLEDGQEQERDLICWIIDRPGIEERKAEEREKTDLVRATSST